MMDDGKLKRQVNLTGQSNSNTVQIMSKTDVKNYEEDKQNIIAYINDIASLLQEHNRKITPIVESYKRRTGQ